MNAGVGAAEKRMCERVEVVSVLGVIHHGMTDLEGAGMAHKVYMGGLGVERDWEEWVAMVEKAGSCRMAEGAKAGGEVELVVGMVGLTLGREAAPCLVQAAVAVVVGKAEGKEACAASWSSLSACAACGTSGAHQHLMPMPLHRCCCRVSSKMKKHLVGQQLTTSCACLVRQAWIPG